jgi:hypothetical protein
MRETAPHPGDVRSAASDLSRAEPGTPPHVPRAPAPAESSSATEAYRATSTEWPARGAAASSASNVGIGARALAFLSSRPWTRLKPTGTRGWVAASAAAVFVLVLQLAYAARGELAARYPTVKAMLSSVCASLGCRVPFPHNPELVKIEASDVRMVDTSRPQLVQLTATLRSYAGHYLAYPALDLVLTNANEHALARRVFVPQEYLGRNRDPNAGFPPHAEITIALELDTGNQNAAGFRLDLLAAP